MDDIRHHTMVITAQRLFRFVRIVSAGAPASFTWRNMATVRAAGCEHTVTGKVYPGCGNQGRQAGDKMLNRCRIKPALFTLTTADYSNVPMNI